MSLLQNSNAIPQIGGYNLTDSVRFRESATAYLERTQVSGTTTTWTYSGWIKRGSLGVQEPIFTVGENNTNDILLYFQQPTPEDRIHFLVRDTSTIRAELVTTAKYRDPSAWYHIVAVYDSTNATSGDRIRLYVNGERITSFDTETYPSLNQTSIANNASYIQRIGRLRTAASYFDGYMTEVNFVDGQALTPSDFGEYNATTGVWKPKKYTGTYGTNGFYLPFKPTTQATGFNTVLYTGNGTSQSIDGVGFAPDFVWVKNRDQPDSNHLYDTVRGAYYRLISDNTAVDAYSALQLSSFNADGFSYGSAHAGNASGEDYVAWCWDAGSSTVSNTDGDITASVRANPATGFSIVTYDPTPSGTVGHGLSTAPELIIEKKRDTTGDWIVGTTVIDGSYDYLRLNTTAAAAASAVAAPTSTVFTPNVGGDSAVAYCFSEVAGFSKFGTYTGNGTSQSINLGFRPAFVMVKRTDSAANWVMFDNTRDVDNSADKYLIANALDVEGTTTFADFTDTGFTINTSAGFANASGGTYIYMAFADTRDYQWNFDASGNKNNWTANNINSNASSDTTYDIMSDVPTLTDEDTANFATLNPLMPNSVSNTTFSDGNLKMTPAANANSYYGLGTIGLKSGKWYFEAQGYRLGTSTSFRIGFSKNQGVVDANIAIYNAAGNYTIEGTTITGKATYTNGDIIGTAVDLDSNTIEFFKNNISQGSVSISSGEWYPHARIYATNSYTTEAIICNFGQQPFKYTPPTGYKKLNTYNLPDSSIVDGSQYMNTVLWTGNGGTQSITGVGFQPDLVWSKKRSSANSHRLFDAVRGAGKLIWSNLTNIESDVGSTEISSFDSDGFTYGGSGANEGSDTVVSWNWRGSDSSAVSNTDGTITSTVSANTTSGFSVVTANSGSAGNKTVGHGLGVAPKLVIMKVRDAVGAWYVWVTGFSASQFLMLNATNAVGTDSRLWANATPTSSVVSFESGYYPATSKELVFYCFADVEGFSKFGSYTGNGSTDGTFVYTGFRPAYVLVKNSTTGGLSWVINDTSRDTYNECNKDLIADGSSAESNPSPGRMDILSNGFKIRSSANSVNQSGNTFIYMAFAENPFKNSLAR
jgi:hypothetical protein